MASGLKKLIGNIRDTISADTSAEDRAALEAITGAQDVFRGLETPTYGEIPLAEYEALGQYDPESISAVPFETRLAEAAAQGESALSGIQTDPRLREAQMASMGALQDIIEGGGMTAADKAQLARLQSQEAQADRGRREAILQNMGARGMGGSGLELLAQLQSGQAATDRQAQADMDAAGIAQQRALDAIMQRGQLASGLQQQDFGQQSQIAQAKDAIARFNAANTQQTALANMAAQNQAAQNQAAAQMQAQQFNVGARNQAGAAGQANRQQIANMNVAAKSDRATALNQLAQQQFNNQIAKAQGVQNPMLAQSQLSQNAADRKAREWSELLGAGVQAGAAASSRGK